MVSHQIPSGSRPRSKLSKPMSAADISDLKGFGRGVYTGREVSRLCDLRTQRITRWVRGYQFKVQSGDLSSSPPIFRADAGAEGPPVLTFLDLVEILFVKAFLQHGVSMPTVRRAAIEGAALFNVTHPFCLKRFETDGRGIFARIAKEVGDEAIVDLLSRQTVFKDVIRPLFKQIQYDVASEIAAAWWPRGKEFPVVLDPTRAFGAPIVAKRGVPTHILAGPVEAGDQPNVVAKWFDVPVKDVMAAVDFERSLLAA